ncbi:RelA/SpoT family protein [Aquirhabdus sp.]|uniref:RelA/SpoT family protein n=1 Tax=Aquirhabdus sp. TaxID=2824160 RepID=UPI00396CBCA5
MTTATPDRELELNQGRVQPTAFEKAGFTHSSWSHLPDLTAGLRATLSEYLLDSQIKQVMDACAFADTAHLGVTRKSGEPYIVHPIAVAEVLGNMRLDTESLMAALLHDVIEDTEVSKEEIEQRFGQTVADIVDGLTKLTVSNDKNDNKAATLRKILTATLNDPRVIVIKLADRLHNMSTLAALKPDRRRAIASETLNIFVPMGRLVGVNEIADQLEILCYENLEPELFKRLHDELVQSTDDRLRAKQHWAGEIGRFIAEHHLHGTPICINNDITLYQRFLNEHADIPTLLHTHAYEIELESIAECDQFAAVVREHFLWSQLTDHIRNPLPGGNQALQLSLSDERGRLDITLRTQLMRKAAQLGVVLGDIAPQSSRSAIQASLRNLGELIDKDCATNTFDALLDYLHREKISVYTPDGDLHELPQGATAVDFAYAASLYLGNHAIAATIDGQPCPLATPLSTGQVIEIITDDLATPNPDWLGFVNTGKARRAIQQVLKASEPTDRLALGQQALSRALQLYQIDIQSLSDEDWLGVLDWQHLKGKAQLFEKIALGALLPQMVATRLLTHLSESHGAAIAENSLHVNQSNNLIVGTDGLDVRYAPCCIPILGDRIDGHLTRRGLVVHRRRCPNLKHELNRHPENVVRLHWQTATDTDPRFPVHLKIDRPITDEESTQLIYLIRQFQGGVERLESLEESSNLSVLVRDRNHLARLIQEMRILLDFPRVTRFGV